MVDRVLIDTLNIKARDFAAKWKGMIRNAPQLKSYRNKDDETLIGLDQDTYPLLAATLDRGLDRPVVGDFFVRKGKLCNKDSFSLSEVIYGLNLNQKVVIEYLMTEFAPDNPMRMYQSMGAITKIAEFFLLGSFYASKGFLEETYKSMSHHDKVSQEFLLKYFKDDFFFKNN